MKMSTACCFYCRDGKAEEDLGVIENLEKGILLRSICDTMVPKLVAQDIPLLRSLLQGVFPGADLLFVEEVILEVSARPLMKRSVSMTVVTSLSLSPKAAGLYSSFFRRKYVFYVKLAISNRALHGWLRFYSYTKFND